LPVQALSGWGFLDTVETLWVIGAHRFDEKVHFDHLLPHLKQIILFEPHPDTFAECQKYHRNDPRVRVLQVAVSDRTGMMDFNVSSNDGLSSSLLSFGEHTKFAPTTRMVGQTRVRTMTWQAARRHFGLPCPQFLVIDAQGAEHSILSGIPTADQRRIGLIYAEASTRPIYAGAKTLDQVDRLLARNFSRAGFFPIHSFGGVHGNAIFVNRGFLNLRAGSSPRSRPCVATPRAPTAIPGTAETVASQIRGRLQRILFGSLRDTMQATRGNADGRGILYLWGAGGYGRQILSILRRLGFSPCAFVDRDESKWGQSIDGLPVVSPAHLWTEFEKSQPASASRPYIVISTTIRSALLADLASHGLTVSADFHVPAI
jgi:FkbM family methyltransferase